MNLIVFYAAASLESPERKKNEKSSCTLLAPRIFVVPMENNTTSDLILLKDIIEHQQKMIAKQDEIIKALRKQYEDYRNEVTKGLDSLLDDRIFKF